MSEFKRGLSDKFISRLNEEYRPETWWWKILNDKDLFIGIRNNYLNVYYLGNSILKLNLINGNLKGETHYKYLLDPGKEANIYIESLNGIISKENLLGELPLLSNFEEDLGKIKKMSRNYAKKEKEELQKILKSNINIIDVEIAFTKEKEEKRDSTKRVDFAAIRKLHNNDYEIVFYEAKLFDSNELRATKTPSVIQQIFNYDKLIEKNRENIIESYIKVKDNFLQMTGFSKKHKDFMRNVKNLDVNKRTKLVIYGFDLDQKHGQVWEIHKDKLHDKLSEENVFLIGKPKGFQRGISK